MKRNRTHWLFILPAAPDVRDSLHSEDQPNCNPNRRIYRGHSNYACPHLPGGASDPPPANCTYHASDRAL